MKRARTKLVPAENPRNIQFWLDVGSRFLLGGFFALCGTVYLRNAFAAMRGVDLAHLTLSQFVGFISLLAMTFFVGFVAYLYAVRLPPISKFAGWLPALVAVLGSFATWGLLLLKPRYDLSISAQLASSALIFTGNILAIYSLRYLGRSFSILPQGRHLITGGPYRYIRHPVYLAEAFATIGAMIQFFSLAAIALIALQFFFQILRMRYEERVLASTFPEYKDYKRRTARLFPGIY